MPTRDGFFLDHLQSVQGNEAWYFHLRYLGRGANGTAFLVQCSSGALFGLQLVLKVFHRISDQTRREAFLEEIKHLRTLRHPAIIDIYDEGVFTAPSGQKHPFAVVEFLPHTLRQLLANETVDRVRALRIASNLLSALQRIHTATPAIVHRDIKPENILVSPSGAKLADFGLARSATTGPAAAADAKESLEASQWPGMPFRYRSPELIARAKDRTTAVGAASDIYQFGTVLYELLTGFNPQESVENILDPIVLSVRDITGAQGPALTGLIGDMLKENPADRPTAADCLQRLNHIHRKFCKSVALVTGRPA